MAQFEVGKTYLAYSVCDTNAQWRLKVTKRTAKRVTLTGVNCDINKSVTLYTDDDGEFCYPLGKYSMAPILRAKRMLNK